MSRHPVCPCCGAIVHALPLIELKPVRCGGCGVRMKRGGWRYWNAVAWTGLAAVGLLVSVVGWITAIDVHLILAAGFVYGLIVLPHIAKYVQVSHGPVCSRCGYELEGCGGPACPECGQAIDVPLGRGDDAAEA